MDHSWWHDIDLSPEYHFMAPLNLNLFVTGQVDCILPDFIYLSDLEGTESLSDLGITHVITLMSRCMMRYADLDLPTQNHLKFEVDDDKKQSLLEVFPKAFAFLDDCKRNQQKVLVHCSAGISRSATVVIAYLIYSHGMTLERAYTFVNERRCVIYPNIGFMNQLNALTFSN